MGLRYSVITAIVLMWYKHRYLGALSSIEDPDYLTAFGSILGVEARQSSVIRASLGEAPFPNPFDTPLDFVSLSSGAWPRSLTDEIVERGSYTCRTFYHQLQQRSGEITLHGFPNLDAAVRPGLL